MKNVSIFSIYLTFSFIFIFMWETKVFQENFFSPFCLSFTHEKNPPEKCFALIHRWKKKSSEKSFFFLFEIFSCKTFSLPKKVLSPEHECWCDRA